MGGISSLIGKVLGGGGGGAHHIHQLRTEKAKATYAPKKVGSPDTTSARAWILTFSPHNCEQ